MGGSPSPTDASTDENELGEIAVASLESLHDDVIMILSDTFETTSLAAVAKTCWAMRAACADKLAGAREAYERCTALCSKVNKARIPLAREDAERRGIRMAQRVIMPDRDQEGGHEDELSADADGGLRWLGFLKSCHRPLRIDWSRTGLLPADLRLISCAMLRADGAGSYFRQRCEQLLLNDNPIGDLGASALAAALAECPLSQLELQNCRLGDAGLVEIAGALSSVTPDPEPLRQGHPDPRGVRRLRRLCLGVNPLGDAGVAALAAFLPLPNAMSLEVLQLGDTAVGDAGAAAIAHALEVGGAMPRGCQLWLASTRISQGGASLLMEASVRGPVERDRLRICW